MTNAAISIDAQRIFSDLCRQQGKAVEQAVIDATLSDKRGPVIFRQLQYSACAGLLLASRWERAQFQVDPAQKHVYVLQPLNESRRIVNEAAVPYIVKIEPLDLSDEKQELKEIAPFIFTGRDADEHVEMLVTVSTLRRDSPFDDLVYLHESYRVDLHTLLQTAVNKASSRRLPVCNVFDLFGQRSSGYLKL